ncbi:MAG: CPBP family intramembrane metalloprotease [Treponema sp.]|jgi:membrane protease YdiL (CAAX protease family)|nr:CPBP family intramembrane metalloprotease [Treponema sp.]
MKLEKYKRPFLFYGIAVIIPWALWFTMGAISHSHLWENHNWVIFGSLIGLAGLCAPMIAAFALILPDKEMRAELISACTNFKGIHFKWWLIIFLLPPASILLAQAISLLFGYNPEQFKLAGDFSFTAGIFPAWFLLVIAPIIEEFGWHTYGIHCIRRRFSLFATCIIFGVIWGIWHMPLSTVKGYYQNVVAETGILYSINFLVSLIPYLIIDNWCYYKTKRNMFLQISQHLMFGFSNEVFRTHPDSKVIQTVLLIIFSAIIVIRERKFFFSKTFDKESDPCSVT